MGVEVVLLLDVVAQGVLCNCTGAGGAARLGHEEVGEGVEDAEGDGTCASGEEQIQGVALGHVRDKVVGAGAGSHAEAAVGGTGSGTGGIGGAEGGSCERTTVGDWDGGDESHGGEFGDGMAA